MFIPGYFKGKKVTVMGLGLLGRGVGDVKFLAEEGAEVLVTDLKTKEQLADSLNELSAEKIGNAAKNISYILGEHRLEDFRNKDFILKAAGVPHDSVYIQEARKNNVPVEMSTALFAALTPAHVVGITGTRGKSTVTHMLYAILQKAYNGTSTKVFLGGNIRGISTLPFLRETKVGDIAVLELDSWQLQGFGERKISPHLSVFTVLLPDHMNYYKNDMQAYLADKAHIFLYQKPEDTVVIGAQVAERIQDTYKSMLHGTVVIADETSLPMKVELQIPGEHNRYNAGLAYTAARALGISENIIIEALEHFTAVPGRLEFLGEKRGVKIYDDNNATTPDATIAALKALRKHKNIVLVMGGTSKGLDMSKLISEIGESCKAVTFYKETGTDSIKGDLHALSGVHIEETETFEQSVKKGMELAETGDILLFSPAFASFGRFFKNEFDRDDQFRKIIASL